MSDVVTDRSGVDGATASDGQASPFVAVVPVRRWLFRVLGLVLAVGGRIPSFTLDRAALIHFGQWGVLARQRGQVGRPGRLRSSLVFVSVFDGEVDQYIVTFASLLPMRFAQVFGFCVKFPLGAPAGPLLAYIDRHTHESPFFHAAYGRASVSDVRAALWVRERLTALASEEPDLSPRQVRARLDELARWRDRDARLAYRTPRWTLAKLAARARFESLSFTTLAPIARGHEGDVVDRLALLQASPAVHGALDRIAATHYARLAVIDPLYDLDDEPMHYAPALLLCSLQFDVPPDLGRMDAIEWYLSRLHEQLHRFPADPWEWCEGYPAAPDRRLFVDFLKVGAVPTGLFLPGIGARAPSVRAALAAQARFERFRAEHLDHAGDDELVAKAFAATFGAGER